MSDPITPPQKTEVIETIKSETTVKGEKPLASESQVAGVSVRGWIAGLIVLTMCVMSFMGKEVTEPLRGATLFALGYYFGSKITKP